MNKCKMKLCDDLQLCLIFLVLTAGVLKMVSHCSLFGDYHIQTFDGTFYDFPGDCSYKLAGDCQKRSFSILGDYQNGKRKSISLYLGEYFDIHMLLDGTVIQGDKRISLPYASSGIFVETETGYYKLSSEEYGFTVRIDTSRNVHILLSERHFNKTCGLCGNFNNFAEDDFIAQEDFLAENSYDFANSWALHGAEKPCKRVSPPSKTCNISLWIADEDLMAKCQVLKTASVFLKCHHHVDPEPFIALCEEDMCKCGEERECHCQAILEYARTCAQQGIILKGWPSESSCNLKCPFGMEYYECVSPCTKKCQSLNINEVCQEQCIDGCSCPVGKVLDGDQCVEASECSCTHKGKHYPPGSSISQDCNTCVCRHGAWVCTNEDCPGDCFVTGQSHFKSFDNKYFTFSGVCQYLLAKDCQDNSFAVVIETVQCADDPDSVCTRSALIRVQELVNSTIKLKHGGAVSLDGQDIQTPLMHGAVHIQHTVMASVRLTYKEDLQIDWDGYGKLLLKLGPTYSSKICGLCGNYNGNQKDDFLTSSGLIEAHVEDFGNSWKLNGDCLDVVKQDSDPCSLNPKRARYAEELCSVLMSAEFEPCHHEVNPAPYVKNCRYDVCACSDGKECLCSAVSTYATACSRKGVLINWRTSNFCAMKCSKDQVYQLCGTPCNQTCRSLSFPEPACKEVCMEGCYCPPGLFAMEDGECVPRSQCACYYDGEIYQPNDVFSNHFTICYCENGVMHCSTKDASNALFPDLFLDYSLSARVKRSLTCKPPLNKFVCPPSNPRAEGIECTKTCQNFDLECVSQGCISGCMCPQGWVRHKNKCIIPEKCPCFHSGREFAQGSSVKIDCNTCVCHNRKWECTENVCDGSCKTIGEAHYLTFDGMKYTFPGYCQYVLVQDYCSNHDGTFRILLENDGCGLLGEKCSKHITVLYDGGEIELSNRKVKIIKPLRDESDLEILRSGQYFILMLGKGISITWDLTTRVTVHLKQYYRGKVCGLCGNFDGIHNNDLLSSNNQLEVDPVNFGNSWKVNSGCADVSEFPSLCNGNVFKQVAVENSCNILVSDIFQECTQLIDPEPYWEICTYDTCACESIGDCACFCNAVAAYAQECTQQGIIVQWRSNNLCPLSCQEKNKAEPEYECEWRYNACAPACPVTCQHPEPLDCPLNCVEGCHAYCPPGKILDEDSEKCIDPAECSVCIHEGRHIPHGKMIILNREDPDHCQRCHCEGTNLSCSPCSKDMTTLVPVVSSTTTTTTTTATPEHTVMVPENVCSKMMDLAFMVDGSSKLSEEDFNTLKSFIVTIMEQLHIGQNKIRVAVLQFHSGIQKYFGLQEKKSPPELRKIVEDMEYSGAEAAFIGEALKYAALYVFGKAPRKNAPKIGILLTASTSPRKFDSALGLASRKKMTIIPIGVGPFISRSQIKLITSQSPSSQAFIMDNVDELKDHASEIIRYLCGLGVVPTAKPLKVATTAVPAITTSHTTSPPLTLSTSPAKRIKDIVIVIEGSDKVGENNFIETKKFVEEVVRRLNVGTETTHITIMQYSTTVTTEYTFTESQSKHDILERIKKIEYHGGSATNTGRALQHVTQTTLIESNGARDQVPHLVFMVTSNPSSDVITRISKNTEIIPIGVGPNVNITELDLISYPNKPTLVDGYEKLTTIVHTLLESCCEIETRSMTVSPQVITTLKPAAVTLAPLPPAVPCDEPMDIVVLLDGSTNIMEPQFEEMKTFVKELIKKVDIDPGNNGTQISVVQYGKTNTLEISWTDLQNKESLLDKVDAIQQRQAGLSRIGEALTYALLNTVPEARGGRPGVQKIAVILVTEQSTDNIENAAYTASVDRVTVFPIGIGKNYDVKQLETLAGEFNQGNIIHLNRVEDLPTMVTLDYGFINKLCKGTNKVCLDDDGNKRKPGEKWMLPDKCHSVTCLPGGQTSVQSHKINCDKLSKPVCRNNLPSIKVEETCGCRWSCPCMCMGSSTKHIVTFDGLAFKLTGNCSYMLFNDKEHDTEVILHNGPCHFVSNAMHNCMKSIEVKHKKTSVQLFDDMKVTVNGEVRLTPFTTGEIESVLYGAIMHEAKIPGIGFVLTFTPKNNEFTIQLSPLFVAKTSGLCGICDQNDMNDFMLRNGSVTPDSNTFIKEWTMQDSPDRICEMPVIEACTGTTPVSDECNILLSPLFEQCRKVVPHLPFFSLCKENSCHGEEICEIIAAYSLMCRLQGICTSWRSPHFCAMQCPSSLEYDYCRKGCTKQCESSANITQCPDSPTEGCFCPEGKVFFNGECANEDVCTQCIDENGTPRQVMETWIPSHEHCQICTCLDNRRINCTTKPCATATPPTCGPCEIPRLTNDAHQCCPEFECVCDLVTCVLPPVPKCEDGLVPVLTNPGECKPNYACACKKEECKLESAPSCSSHRKRTVEKTQCCDKYECTCNCVNSTVSCPLGYSSESVTNDCGCTTTTCNPDKVCVHHEVIYHTGHSWEENCKECTCTNEKDSITGLYIAECFEKTCSEICPPGETYTKEEGECCGKCKKANCQEVAFGTDGQEINHWHVVGDIWRSSLNPCLINECNMVNGEAFVQQKNVSCSHLKVPKCPTGFELQCNRVEDCCPTCECIPVNGCVLNGTIVGAGKTVIMDACNECECRVENDMITKFQLRCKKTTCKPCPDGYIAEKINGSCCGKCKPTVCSVKLKSGRIVKLKPNETIQDGCDSNHCKVNDQGEFVWEKRITSCPPFNREKCLAGGGKIAQITETCCERCVEAECKQVTGVIKTIMIDDCVTENNVNIHYCEGKCTSKAVYSLEKEKMENQCICCSATATEPMKVPLRCGNGTIVQHEVLNAKQCDCLSHECE
uniref:von Willebrand factor n=1 Tax=Latimeria chalumnae TaxID=7897 RepID=H3AU93_LATCH